MTDTIAAIATGAVVSAIGIVRLSGPEAISIADRLFRCSNGRTMREAESRKLMFGLLQDENGAPLDSCLCTVSRAPHTYTGEDTAEFQCHGSPAVLRAVLESCFACGARQAAAGEFTKRAFLNRRLELTQAEAVADLIDAESVESARNAASQLSGAIRKKTEEISSALIDISAHYHAVLDYPDEDIEEFTLSGYASTLSEARTQLSRLLRSFDRGKLLREGIPAVIVGRPNAGKSSLMNLLLGYDRAIVSAVAGTTRDTIEEKLHLGSLTLRLTDTAGIRDTGDEIERLGVARSRDALRRAELVLVLVDGSERTTEEDLLLVREAEKAPHAVLIYSKNDLCSSPVHLDTTLPAVELSAKTGDGLERLTQVLEELFPLPAVPAGEILTNARQAEAVGRALEYLTAAQSAMEQGLTPDIVLTETEGALSALGDLSGASLRQDITNRIFARFCVGK